MSTKKAAAKQQLHEMEVLLELARRISTIESLDELLETIVAMTAKETGADRGTLFLYDDAAGQLYSRVAQGTKYREIRVLSQAGIAGHVFTTGEGLIVPDAYAHPKFDRSVDDETGYKTHNVVCAPIRTGKGEIVGVLQMQIGRAHV